MNASKERTYLVPEQFHLLAAMAMPTDDESSLRPKINCIAMQEDAGKIHYHVTDGRVAAVVSIPTNEIPEPSDGRFPDLEAAIPKTLPVCVIRVDPHHLRKVLELATSFDLHGEHGLFLEYHGDKLPLVFRVGHESPGCGMVGLCMPLHKD